MIHFSLMNGPNFNLIVRKFKRKLRVTLTEHKDWHLHSLHQKFCCYNVQKSMKWMRLLTGKLLCFFWPLVLINLIHISCGVFLLKSNRKILLSYMSYMLYAIVVLHRNNLSEINVQWFLINHSCVVRPSPPPWSVLHSLGCWSRKVDWDPSSIQGLIAEYWEEPLLKELTGDETMTNHL